MFDTGLGRQKLQEITSAGGVLLAGMGLLLADRLTGAAVWLLVIGFAIHGWGMVDRHLSERMNGTELPAWVSALYWLCWAVLAGAIIVIARQVREASL